MGAEHELAWKLLFRVGEIYLSRSFKPSEILVPLDASSKPGASSVVGARRPCPYFENHLSKSLTMMCVRRRDGVTPACFKGARRFPFWDAPDIMKGGSHRDTQKKSWHVLIFLITHSPLDNVRLSGPSLSGPNWRFSTLSIPASLAILPLLIEFPWKWP